MFNGIIYNQGKIVNIKRRKNGINLFLQTNIKITNKSIGISIACDGVCLTLISINNKIFEFYLSYETLKRTKFKNLIKGSKINLELPLKFGDHVSGHICQGHVDTVGKVNKISKKDKSKILDFVIPKYYQKYLIEKASILINGVSLTISKITKNGFQVWTIPHTLKLTNLSDLKNNEIVNIEIDILSKYVKKYFYEK